MIIQRYIHTEILRHLFWIASLLLLIYASDKFADYLSDAAVGGIPAAMIFELLGLKLVSSLPKLLPVALFLAVLSALSRLACDREILVMRCAGVDAAGQLGIVLRLLLPLCAGVAAVVFFIAPVAEQKVHTLKIQAHARADVNNVPTARFKELRDGEGVVYVSALAADQKTLLDVFLKLDQGDTPTVLTAESALIDSDAGSGAHYIKFSNGRRYQGQPGAPDHRITQFKTYLLKLDSSGPVPERALKPEATSSPELLFSEQPQHQSELQWRFAVVLSCLLLPLLAVLLCQFPVAERRYLLVLMAVLIYFTYNNLLGISMSLLKQETIPAFIGLWWVHGILLLALACLYRRLPGVRTERKGARGD